MKNAPHLTVAVEDFFATYCNDIRPYVHPCYPEKKNPLDLSDVIFALRCEVNYALNKHRVLSPEQTLKEDHFCLLPATYSDSDNIRQSTPFFAYLDSLKPHNDTPNGISLRDKFVTKMRKLNLIHLTVNTDIDADGTVFRVLFIPEPKLLVDKFNQTQEQE